MAKVLPAQPRKIKPSVSFYDNEGSPPDDIRVGENVTVILRGEVISIGTNKDGKRKTFSVTVEHREITFRGEDLSDEDIEEMSDEEIKKRLKEARA